MESWSGQIKLKNNQTLKLNTHFEKRFGVGVECADRGVEGLIIICGPKEARNKAYNHIADNIVDWTKLIKIQEVIDGQYQLDHYCSGCLGDHKDRLVSDARPTTEPCI